MKQPDLPALLEPTLTILSGFHEGAVQRLAAGFVRIGGDGADIILADGGLDPVHVEASIQDGFVVVRALGRSVIVDAAGPLAHGHAARVALPASVTVAGVAMRFDGPRPAAPAAVSRRRFSPRNLGLAAATLCVAAVALAPPIRLPASARAASVDNGTLAGAASDGTPHADAESARPRPAPPRPAPPRPVPAMALADAAALLHDLTTGAGLTRVQVRADGEMVVASGTVPPASVPAWLAVREAFDRRTNGRAPLRNLVQTRADHPVSLQLDSVWTGNFPNVVVGGVKYLEGGVLPNGWVLERVAAGRLTLRRGDESVDVVF